MLLHADSGNAQHQTAYVLLKIKELYHSPVMLIYLKLKVCAYVGTKWCVGLQTLLLLLSVSRRLSEPFVSFLLFTSFEHNTCLSQSTIDQSS